MKYIAKPNTWFKEGTECKLICPYNDEGTIGAIFSGVRVCENPESEKEELGKEYEDEEGCSYSEFEIIEN